MLSFFSPKYLKIILSILLYFFVSKILEQLIIYVDQENIFFFAKSSYIPLIHNIIFTILIVLILKFVFELNFNLVTFKNNFSVKKIIITVAVGILFALLVKCCFFIIDFVQSKNNYKIISYQKNIDFYLALSIVFVTPINEELFFRKHLFKRLLDQTSYKISLVLSSFIFAAFHLPDIYSFSITLVGGIIATTIYYKFKNIIYPILFHIIWNFFNVFF